jgi:DNA-binding MarR family transcriptional regulator
MDNTVSELNKLWNADVGEGFTPIRESFLCSWHIFTPKLTYAEVMVFLILFQHKWHERKPFPSTRTLAEMYGCKQQNIATHIQSLAIKGYIKIESGHAHKSNRYDLTPILEQVQIFARSNDKGLLKKYTGKTNISKKEISEQWGGVQVTDWVIMVRRSFWHCWSEMFRENNRPKPELALLFLNLLSFKWGEQDAWVDLCKLQIQTGIEPRQLLNQLDRLNRLINLNIQPVASTSNLIEFIKTNKFSFDIDAALFKVNHWYMQRIKDVITYQESAILLPSNEIQKIRLNKVG